MGRGEREAVEGMAEREGSVAGAGPKERQSTMRQLHGKHIRKPQQPLPRASGPATYDVATAVPLSPFPFPLFPLPLEAVPAVG